jgi:D-3-phosphoglycerate dehydrogenase
LEAATEACIAVTNVPDYGIDEVASQSIALAMTLSRKVLKLDQIVKETQMQISPGNREAVANILHPILRTQDQTMGIIGMGRIGTSVALKARGLGMRVIAYDPYVFGAVMRSHGVEPVDYDTLLKESDIISINADLNDETRHMVGEREFKKMKPTSYLVNTARGAIVNQEALVKALKEGIIAGAGLDVTEIEPIPADDPILQAPNVILTGHTAWYSTAADSPQALWHKATAQTVMALSGEFPIYTVNPDVKRSWIKKWGKKA